MHNIDILAISEPVKSLHSIRTETSQGQILPDSGLICFTKILICRISAPLPPHSQFHVLFLTKSLPIYFIHKQLLLDIKVIYWIIKLDIKKKPLLKQYFSKSGNPIYLTVWREAASWWMLRKKYKILNITIITCSGLTVEHSNSPKGFQPAIWL